MSKDPEPAERTETVVVGVGASAGGLEAFQLLVSGLPSDHSLVLVLIQHLDPDHESLMPELVAARTKSPVHSVTNNMTIEKGHIYLIPPGYEMEIEGEQLLLKKFETPRGLRRPIDRFYRSLAKSHGDNAIAIILSGTGSDGAEGAREVKGAGGLIFVQDPRQAKYDGMPQSVIERVGADLVTKAEEAIDFVLDYFNLRTGMEPDLADDRTFIQRTMRHVKFRTGHDFSEYKEGTLMRRIAVRMSVLNLASPHDYLRHLVETKTEADLLFQDLLINVTGFFRDPEHFETVRKDIIPSIVENVEEDGEIRIWVAGCSTGEEAYSIAILVLEEASRVKKNCKLVLFATDIDEKALNKGRAGKYPDEIVASVPSEYLDRYFRPTHDGYEIGTRLREAVRFSRHSFIKDPPFSKLDMVSCRNVLIYMRDTLQDTSMRVFHYGLREDGFLFLGPSENPSNIFGYFQEVSSRSRLFVRSPGPAKPLNLAAMSSSSPFRIPHAREGLKPAESISDVERRLTQYHLPPYLHVDQNSQVVFASGSATKYIAFRPGNLRNNMYDVIAKELETTVRRITRSALKSRTVVEGEYQGELAGEPQRLLMVADPLLDGSLILAFHDKMQLRTDIVTTVQGVDSVSDDYIRQLEIDLDESKQAVRITVEELETSNEELKSSNEEMMSMNEELQSANEELSTINDELQEKVRALNQANIDLNNYVDSTRVATVFLDEKLNLISFTPEAEQYFNFVNADIGRPMDDLNSVIDQTALVGLCEKTAEDKAERVGEFLARDGVKSLQAKVMPYSPDGNRTNGVVFTLVDITDLKNAVLESERQQDAAELRLHEVEQLYRNSPIGMALISEDMRYQRINQRLADINGEPLQRHIGRTVREIIPAVADQTEKYVKKVLQTGKPILGQRVSGTIYSDPGTTRIWESEWHPYFSENKLSGVTVYVREVTREVEISESFPRVMRELEHRVKNMLSNVTALVQRAGKEIGEENAVFEKLRQRIVSLSKTYALLNEDQSLSANLSVIISSETIDVYGPEHVTLSGPEIRINSQATLALGMVIHELATNSAKYGAFSVDDGGIDVKWLRVIDANGDRLKVTWKEQGGPPVRIPSRTGFGSQLIEATINGTLSGNFETEWNEAGVVHVIDVEFDRVSSLEDE